MSRNPSSQDPSRISSSIHAVNPQDLDWTPVVPRNGAPYHPYESRHTSPRPPVRTNKVPTAKINNTDPGAHSRGPFQLGPSLNASQLGPSLNASQLGPSLNTSQRYNLNGSQRSNVSSKLPKDGEVLRTWFLRDAETISEDSGELRELLNLEMGFGSEFVPLPEVTEHYNVDEKFDDEYSYSKESDVELDDENIKQRRDKFRGKQGCYARLARYEQFNLLGHAEVDRIGKWPHSMWLFMCLAVGGYAVFCSVYWARNLIHQSGWCWYDWITLICVVWYLVLSIADFFTFLLSTIERNLIEFTNVYTGDTVKAAGNLQYDQMTGLYNTYSLLNADLVRFLLYCNHFFIINGMIVSLLGLAWWVYWFCLDDGSACSVWTYVYVFVPLLIFPFLVIFRKSIITQMALAAYWPADLEYSTGRFINKVLPAGDLPTIEGQADVHIAKKYEACTQALGCEVAGLMPSGETIATRVNSMRSPAISLLQSRQENTFYGN